MLQDYQVLYLDNDIPINRSFYCNNGDIGTRGLEVHVLDNSQAKDCTGLSMKMIVKVPSGEMFEATVANGLVTVLNAATGIYQILFPNNMGKGRLIAEIQLSNTVPEIIVSRKFRILGDGSLTSDGNISVLPGAGILYPIIAAEPARVAAEIVRVANNAQAQEDEAARIAAEAARAGFYGGFSSQLAAIDTAFEAAAANLTQDSEVIIARDGEDSLGINIGKIKTEAAKKANYRQQAGEVGQEDKVNMIAGYIGNKVAENLYCCTIAGGGSLNMENVIGGNTANVDTGVSNAEPMDLTTQAEYSTILGGYDNVANGLASFIASFHSFISNLATHGTISGGSRHKIQSGDYNTIAGGTLNDIPSGSFVTVSGGTTNKASANSAVVAGGSINEASGNSSVVSGGGNNKATGVTSVVCGGSNNLASGAASFAAGGYDNIASGAYASIPGGANNRATNEYATALGGRYNEANEKYSIASGFYAVARMLGQKAHAYGKFVTAGDAQAGEYMLKNLTTNATATIIGLNGTLGIQMPQNSSWKFKYEVIARRVGGDGESKSWEIKGQARNNVGQSIVIDPTPEIKIIGSSAGTETWDCQLLPGADSLNIRGYGELDKTIYWVAKLETVEVIA